MMLPNGRLKAILILVAGVSFVALGIYQMAWADEDVMSEQKSIICGADFELVNGECLDAEVDPPEETKDEVIRQLIAENKRVIAENNELKQANYGMRLLITDMQNKIANLEAIVLEQIRVMMAHFK